jgi:hypothetical protein
MTQTNPFTTTATTGQTFTMERAAEIFAGAFKPRACDVKTVNVGTRIEYEVSDGKRTLVKGSIPSEDLAQKDYNLRNTIMRARRDVEAQGYKLVAWEMPST